MSSTYPVFCKDEFKFPIHLHILLVVKLAAIQKVCDYTQHSVLAVSHGQKAQLLFWIYSFYLETYGEQT